jgi:hypothetical protein
VGLVVYHLSQNVESGSAAYFGDARRRVDPDDLRLTRLEQDSFNGFVGLFAFHFAERKHRVSADLRVLLWVLRDRDEPLIDAVIPDGAESVDDRLLEPFRRPVVVVQRHKGRR